MTWPGLTPSQATLREALSFSFRLRKGLFADRTVHALLRILPQLNWDRLCPVRLVFVELGFQYWGWWPEKLPRRGPKYRPPTGEACAPQESIQRHAKDEERFPAPSMPGEEAVLTPPAMTEKQVPSRQGCWRYVFFALAGGGAAVLAVATSEVKAAASFTAISARTLRSSATPAALRPCISWPEVR